MVDQLAAVLAAGVRARDRAVARARRARPLRRRVERACCPSPLCAPSRAAMLTGRPPSEIGVYDNAAALPASVPMLMHRLRAAGYETCLTDKMHFIGPDQLHGFEQRLTTDIHSYSMLPSASSRETFSPSVPS
jgi:choline-sulfatase